jgi:hypothetical protein
MALDEQLRQLADRVPAPPPGDAAASFRRGVRRRRVRRAGGVAAAVAVVAAIAGGVGPMLAGPTLPSIADRPPASTSETEDDAPGPSEDRPVVAGPPQLTVSAGTPFPWSVAVSEGGDGRWCATAVRGSMQGADGAGQPCDQLLTGEQIGNPDGFGTGGSEVDAAAPAEPRRGLSWGFAPAGAEGVFVLFSDGSREQAAVAAGGSMPAPVWAVGYAGVQVHAVEAHRDDELIAGQIVARTEADAGSTASPQAVFGALVQREDLEAFTDEQRQLLDLRAGDELFRLPIEGSDRSVGIRTREGLTPLMFATACELLREVDLPDGWLGICLEVTDPQQGRVRGLFPHGR